MRTLLDTNILIHREAATVVRQDIGQLFLWLDRLQHQKFVHPVSIQEISAHKDPRVRESFQAKLASYRILQAPAELTAEVQGLSVAVDRSDNDRRDTKILNELVVEHVDLLITEDRGILKKAEHLGVGDRVFTIDGFLEKAAVENPDLTDYEVLAVRRSLFGRIDVNDEFFDQFRWDYDGFDSWFARKSEEPVYVCHADDKLVAFLYLKVEDEREPYPDIVPTFRPMRRLKIGTLKVELNGFRLGERFLKIVFDNAIKQRVDEIYVTIFPRTAGQQRLINLLNDFGFVHHGAKRNDYGDEEVYTRSMVSNLRTDEPRQSYPFVCRANRCFLVPIYPEYHTELLPDSILTTESPSDFVEQEPHRNAISKVYVSRSRYRDLQKGDVIVFYRTGGYFRSVVTTLGVVERVHLNIGDEERFIRLCRKRSVFSDDELREHWRYNRRNHPFIVEFLYCYSFPRRPNLAALIENGVIADVESAPRGFERITSEQFETILRLTETDPRLIIDQAAVC